MPIPDDIMGSAVIGRERKRGMALGREEGLAEGILESERRHPAANRQAIWDGPHGREGTSGRDVRRATRTG